MIILVTGGSHTGKTYYAQKLMEQYSWPYLSLDLLKMGLIRSQKTDLTPADDFELQEYMWPIVREMIRTAIENEQDLIVEGIYIPFTWAEDFSEAERSKIDFRCLVFSPSYIKNHFDRITKYASIIESRLPENSIHQQDMIQDSERNMENCRRYNYKFILMDDYYE